MKEKSYQYYLKKLKTSKNLILRGAPGTGKTYLARKIADELTGRIEDQIGFVQFHPSYDYTDFVEGLRPVPTEDSQIGFELQDGIFRKFCEKAKNASKTGGQDNFNEAWGMLVKAINEENGNYKIPRSSVNVSINSQGNIKFNGPVATKERVYRLYKEEATGLVYETYQKIVLDYLKSDFHLKNYQAPTKIDMSQNFVFIIDEINRGEISKIFGELFFSIDPGYRGEKGKVTTQYANMREGEKEFYIPENVYIIGTMNDIDRSVDTFDFAMRRRFRFVEVTAESQLHMLDELGDIADKAKVRLKNLNQAISEVEGLNSHYHIGPSYFLKLKDLDDDFDVLWSDYLEPLLEDYLRGSYDEVDSLNQLKAAYNSIIDNHEESADEG